MSSRPSSDTPHVGVNRGSYMLYGFTAAGEVCDGGRSSQSTTPMPSASGGSASILSASGGGAGPVGEDHPVKTSSLSIKDFELGQVIGEGSFGFVLLARLKAPPTYFAIKAMLKAVVSEEDVQREQRIHRGLHHPAICQLFGYFYDEMSHYLVLNLAAKGSLDARIEKTYEEEQRGLTEKEAVKYLREIADGLDYIHTQRIVHRDIKPTNIYLTQADEIQIADFGLSIEMPEGTLLSEQCGSPVYMAPEVRAAGEYGFPADLWPLGISLLEMLHGTLPVEVFIGEPEEMQDLIPENVSPACRDLLAGLLTIQPAGRLTASAILRHLWIA